MEDRFRCFRCAWAPVDAELSKIPPVTFFKRVFSADYRRGLAAEAAGDYPVAARSYALAGERAKVSEMHLYLAERAATPEARLGELRTGVHWADEETPEGRSMRRRIARAMLARVRKTGVVGDSDRALLHEAAGLFESAGDAAGAGECHELAGDEMRAAEFYQRAGDLERLEAVLGREETRRLAENRHRDAFAEYQLHLRAGARDRARAALAEALALQPDERYRSLLDGLDARLLIDARVNLRVDGQPMTLVGAFPLALGREPSCQVPLRDPGISRRHLEVVLAGAEFRVRDAGSRNGTFLAGLRLGSGSELPIEGEVELGLGEFCGLRCRVVPAAALGPGDLLLYIEVVRGLDRGRKVLAGAGALPLGEGAAELRFVDGRPLFMLAPPGGRLVLNGVQASGSVQLIRGDRLELDRGQHVLRIEVD